MPSERMSSEKTSSEKTSSEKRRSGNFWRVLAFSAALGSWGLAGGPLGAAAADTGEPASGIVAEFETRNLQQSDAPVESSRLMTLEGQIRLDHFVGDELQLSVIYRDRVGILVTHRDKSYQVVDDAALEALAKNLRVATAEVDSKLAKMQPEHSLLFVESLRTAAENARPAALTATAEEGEREGRLCRKYLYERGGQTVREVWATRWEGLGPLGPPLKQAIADLGELYHLLGKPYADVKSNALAGLPIFASPPHLFTDLARLDGFPVVFTSWEAGRPVAEARLRELATRSLKVTDFVPPTDYQRKATLN